MSSGVDYCANCDTNTLPDCWIFIARAGKRVISVKRELHISYLVFVVVVVVVAAEFARVWREDFSYD